ncbi:ThiF family adenylyltransferase [Kordia sp. YSTF-M3]|uniref:ThiF family adenylyltransferase n=1 Tax=Kordia aestuariivivens TaxID=2759037 RepID=A0ABR7QGI8_9FLAO|nr:ThiF family adenylyltransferase [Kordia aestuariivivens]MBC8757695.1 ThiF family adenylyltransferase [Kordia aestuariivivens]
MEDRYSRNRIYLTEEEQKMIKDYPIILGGSGIGSVIAECALRLGFENITIIDGDQVELSNLNRQNYTEHDIDIDKTEAIKNRLKSINSNANIKVHNSFLTIENVEEYIKGHKIAINALDFTTEVPLVFDKLCQKNNIPVLHPYNLGWGGLVTVITPEGLMLDTIEKPDETFNEVVMVKYASNYLKFWGTPCGWIDDIIRKYQEEKEQLSPPQLSIASWTVAAMCTNVMFNIATKKEYKKFPEFYLSTIMD